MIISAFLKMRVAVFLKMRILVIGEVALAVDLIMPVIFIGGGLTTTTTTLEKPRVANEPRDQIMVVALYFQTLKLRIPEIPASDTCALGVWVTSAQTSHQPRDV